MNSLWYVIFVEIGLMVQEKKIDYFYLKDLPFIGTNLKPLQEQKLSAQVSQ